MVASLPLNDTAARLQRASARLLQVLAWSGEDRDADLAILRIVAAELHSGDVAAWDWQPARHRLLLRLATRESATLHRLLGVVDLPAGPSLESLFGAGPAIPLTAERATSAGLLPLLRVLRAEHALLLLVHPTSGDPILLTFGSHDAVAADDLAVGAGLQQPLALLFSTARRLQREIEKNRVLTSINRATLAISSSLDERKVYQTFADETRRLITFERASLTLLDESGTRLRAYVLNAELSSQAGPDRSIPVAGSGVGWVATHGLPLIREDLLKGHHFAEDAMMTVAGMRSSIHVPLVAHAKVLGTFNLSSVEPRAYSRDDLAILQPIADQLAFAIENAALYGERGRVLRELSAIQSVTDAALLNLDVQVILDTLTERVGRAMAADWTACFLFDPVGRQLTLRAVAGGPLPAEPVSVRMGEGFAGRVAQAGPFTFVRDIEQDPLIVEPILRRGLRSLMGVPLRAKDRVLGVLCVAFGHIYRLQPDDVQLLRVLADRAAGVVDHVQLREEKRRSQDELNALYQVSAIAGGSFHVESILEDLLLAVEPVLPCTAGCIFTVDAEQRSITQVAAYHFPRVEGAMSFTEGEGLVGWAIRHNRAVAVPDCFEDPRFVPRPGIQGPCSMLVVPLTAGARVAAALVLTRPREHPFTTADIQLAQALASHAAQVIENAVLLQSLTDARLVSELARAEAEFVGAASHELRTPLTAIKALVETLLRPDLRLSPATQSELLTDIQAATTHLARVMDQLLDVTRIKSGRLETETQLVDVAPLIQECIAQLRELNPARAIELTSAPGLGLVRADPTMLRGVVYNLVTNAIKYSPATAPVTIAVVDGRPVGATDEGAAVEIQVSDRGEGIAAADLPRLFRPFSRLSPGQPRVPGAGLGLYVSKAFVEAMGGEIGVVSEPGAGSTFWARLASSPLASRRAGAPSQPQQLPAAAAPGALVGKRPPGESAGTVLVVDDEPAVRRAAELQLAAAGYRVLTAATGEAGLALARSARPDLILLDVVLPGLSGLDLARKLRRRPETRQIPFVYLTAKTQAAERLDGFRVGAAAYVTKPFSPRLLIDVVASTLQQSALERRRQRRAEVRRLAAKVVAHAG